MYVEPMPEAIRRARILNRLSQAELAKRAGVSYSYINLIESGKRGCSPKTAGKIADALQLGMEELFVVDRRYYSSVTEQDSKK
ncbi:MAG: helix-turn-helix transcriptional regulator [Candidatus Geothermincolia bacterium]